MSTLVDLHMHTTASDGEHTPSSLVDLAKDSGIQIMSITDHDTVDGLDEAIARAEEQNITLVPGIEISVKDKRELHILGYCIEYHRPEFEENIKKLKKYRTIREDITLDFLHQKGFDITEEEVLEEAGNDVVGRPHFAAVMMRKGYVDTKKDAFDKYLASKEFLEIHRPKPTINEAIEMIKSGRGIPVLAHPHSMGLIGNALEQRIKHLKDSGLKGMECYYNSYAKNHSDKMFDVNYYLNIADKYGLLATGGSDYHGEKVKPGISIGCGRYGPIGFNDEEICDKLKSTKEKMYNLAI